MRAEWLLPEDLSAAAVARTYVAGAIRALDVPDDLADDVVLVASELAANAVRHGLPPVTLSLQHAGGRLRVCVSNGVAGDAAPVVVQSGPEADHGRGLAIVRALAEDFGWVRENDRLRVWADISFP